jgi:hypothetical protein
MVSMVKDPVIAIKWTKERDLELGAGLHIDHFGLADRLLPVIGTTFRPATVHDLDRTIRIDRVTSCDFLHVLLEGGLIAELLIPQPHIPLDIEGLCRLRHRPVPYRSWLWDGGTCSQQNRDPQDSENQIFSTHGRSF